MHAGTILHFGSATTPRRAPFQSDSFVLQALLDRPNCRRIGRISFQDRGVRGTGVINFDVVIRRRTRVLFLFHGYARHCSTCQIVVLQY